MLSKFYKKIRANILSGRKMTTSKKCPPFNDKNAKTNQGKIIMEKPNMRNLHLKQSLRNLYIAIALGGFNLTLFYIFHNRVRKQAYEDFYANYDPMAAFSRMQRAGYLSSCPPEQPEAKKRNCLLNLVTSN